MSKSPKRLASQSRPLLGRSADLIQSPCSRQTMRMRVSARLQATAAPEAPDPTIKTPTRSLPAMSAPARRAVVAPERPPTTHGLEQRPVALLELVALREGRTRLEPQRQQHAVVAIVGTQDDAPERHSGRTAGLVVGVDQSLAVVTAQRGESAAGLLGDRRQGLA